MKQYPFVEIIDAIEKYHNDTFSINERNASFDLCYTYFQKNKENLLGENVEKSCMYLWGYLASWGMLRSGKLKMKSPASLKDLVVYIATECDKKVWNINVRDYTNAESANKLCELYNDISMILNNFGVSATATLVTKIMLGVFGNVPALDINFKKWMNHELGGGYLICKPEIALLGVFYETNKNAFDQIKIHTLDIHGQETDVIYPTARLLDMFGFAKGELL